MNGSFRLSLSGAREATGCVFAGGVSTGVRRFAASWLRLAALLLLALPVARAYVVDGVNEASAADSPLFYDSGKGYYWQASPTYYAMTANAKKLVESTGNYAFLGQLQERLDATWQGSSASYSQAAFAPLQDDANMCWAYTGGNMLQYWMSCFGVFYKGTDPLPYGLTYDRQHLEALGGTQSLQTTMALYDAFRNEGANTHYSSRWFLTGKESLGANSPLLETNSAAGGYFSQYYAAGEAASFGLSLNSGASLDISTATQMLQIGFHCEYEGGRLVQYTDLTDLPGRLVQLGVFGQQNGETVGHAVTCYGYELDAAGNLDCVLIANSDDMAYGMIRLYVGEKDGQCYFYSDAARTTLWNYAGVDWYLGDVEAIHTPMVLYSMYLEYHDASTALTWNGAQQEWRNSAAEATADVLPTASTGWQRYAGSGTEHADYYNSYYEEGRAVQFNDLAAGSAHGGEVRLAEDIEVPTLLVENNELAYHFSGEGQRLQITGAKFGKSGAQDATFAGIRLEVSGMVEVVGEGALRLGQDSSLCVAENYTLSRQGEAGDATLRAVTLTGSGMSGNVDGARTHIANTLIDIAKGVTFSLSHAVLEDSSRITDAAASLSVEDVIICVSNNNASGTEGLLAEAMTLSATGLEAGYTLTLAEGSSLYTMACTALDSVLVTGTSLTLDLSQYALGAQDEWEKYAIVAIQFADAQGEKPLASFDATSLSIFVSLGDGWYCQGYYDNSPSALAEGAEGVSSLYFMPGRAYQVPEPMTATLGLLALAALSARRRRS